jgi:hypothetical protein
MDETGSSERHNGADLGVVLQVRGGGLQHRRALLLQAKRLHPGASGFSGRSVFGDLVAPHGRSQAKKMLSITSAACFLLYGPSTLGRIVAGTLRSAGAFDPHSLDYLSTGIAVISASVLEGLTPQHWQSVQDLIL